MEYLLIWHVKLNSIMMENVSKIADNYINHYIQETVGHEFVGIVFTCMPLAQAYIQKSDE